MKKFILTLSILLLVTIPSYALIEWISVTLNFSGSVKDVCKSLQGYYAPTWLEKTQLHNANKTYFNAGDTVEIRVLPPVVANLKDLGIELIKNGVAVYSCSQLEVIADTQLYMSLELFMNNNPDVKAVYNWP